MTGYAIKFSKEFHTVLGWMILFGLMVILGAVSMFVGDPAAASARMASLVFTLLFLAGLFTLAARGRAR